MTRRVCVLLGLVVLLHCAFVTFGSDEEYIPPEEGWTDGELRCLNDMEDADGTYDHVLNHHEYMVFADEMANRLFDMTDALDEETEWELRELFDILVLQNPSSEMYGVDIFGSAYGATRVINEKQEKFLKRVCRDTEKALKKIGPDSPDE
ncbi:expressed unknown protein [Seminavis robusta]|uniref:Uncharacterized protein n=1 Tax=Seminavis robusta TaxID=568900 RepID=A0A9N8EEP5_9STRA|nr:expressed unknown protein [Seminavis robusta]|eukprot:Sro1043_g234790.1 n/a (150) ;mRNA; r:11362-11811